MRERPRELHAPVDHVAALRLADLLQAVHVVVPLCAEVLRVQPPNTKGYSSTYLAIGFANVRAGTQKKHLAVLFLGTRPNISESHSEISTRVPFCIAPRTAVGHVPVPRHPLSNDYNALARPPL